MMTRVERVRSDEDYEALLATLIEYERSLDPDLRHGIELSMDGVRSAFAAPHATFLARVDNEVAGCVAGIQLDASTVVLQRLYAPPRFRGRGVGRALVEAVLTFARENGRERVVLDTDASRLQAAVRLYEALGFTPCEPYASVDYRHPTFMERKV